MVYMEYIFDIFNRSVVSVVYEITWMKFYIICNYIGALNVGVWGTDFLRGIYINELRFGALYI